MTDHAAVWHKFLQVWRRQIDKAGIDLEQLVTHIELDDGGNATREGVRGDELVFWKADEVGAELTRNREFWAKHPGMPGLIIDRRVSGGKGEFMTLQLLVSAYEEGWVPFAGVLTAASLYEHARERRSAAMRDPNFYGEIYNAAKYLLEQAYKTDIPWSGFIKHALPKDRRMNRPNVETLEAAMGSVAAEHVEFLTNWKIIRASFPKPSSSDGPEGGKAPAGVVTSLAEWRNRAFTEAPHETDNT